MPQRDGQSSPPRPLPLNILVRTEKVEFSTSNFDKVRKQLTNLHGRAIARQLCDRLRVGLKRQKFRPKTFPLKNDAQDGCQWDGDEAPNSLNNFPSQDRQISMTPLHRKTLDDGKTLSYS